MNIILFFYFNIFIFSLSYGINYNLTNEKTIYVASNGSKTEDCGFEQKNSCKSISSAIIIHKNISSIRISNDNLYEDHILYKSFNFLFFI